MTTQQILEEHRGQRQRCEIWSRAMGYFRPVHTYNPGKQQEHEDRKHFLESRVS